MTRPSPEPPFSRDVLRIDPEREAERIAEAIRRQVSQVLRRRGAVVGLSGGVDSSVTAALCVRALGERRVLGLLMPERDSDPDSVRLGRQVADGLGMAVVVEDIDAALEALGCFARRDAAIRRAVPDYTSEHRCKLLLAKTSDQSPYTFFHLEVESPDGSRSRIRLPAAEYMEVVAATSFKQRTRKMMEYHHADRLHYAVVGTPNRLEYDQGFFVKSGDGAADLKPIAHLYKSQVYQLAEWLGIPEEIRSRTPTTDTFPLRQSQDEFYFPVPYEQLDLCLWGVTHGTSAEEVASATGMSVDLVRSVYADIAAKRRATIYQHLAPLLVEEVQRSGGSGEDGPHGDPAQ